MRRLIIIAVIVACISVSVTGVPAGAMIEVQSYGVDFLGKAIVKDAIERLQRITAPDIPAQRFDCVGKCTYEVKNIVLTGLKCTNAPVFTFEANKGVRASVSGCSVDLSANWRLHRSTFPSFSCSGSVTGTFIGMSVDATAAIQKTPENSLYVQLASTSVHMNDDKLHFRGDLCALLGELVKKTIEKNIKKQFNNELSSKLPVIVNPILEKYTLPTKLAINSLRSVLNIPVTAAPTITTTRLLIPFLGLVSPMDFPKDQFNETVPELEDTTKLPTKMARLGISTFFLNSLAFSAYDEGLMMYKTNSSIAGFDLDIIAMITAPPTTEALNNATEGNIKLNLKGSIIAMVVGTSLGFAVNIEASVPVFVGARDQTIFGALGPINISDINIDVVNTTIHLDAKLLAQWASSFLNTVIKPYINAVLQRGVTIPLVQHIGIDGTTFTTSGSFLFCDTNFVEKKQFLLDAA